MEFEYKFLNKELLEAETENKLNSKQHIISEFIWLFLINPFILLACFLAISKNNSIKMHIILYIFSFLLSLFIYIFIRKKTVKYMLRSKRKNINKTNLFIYKFNPNQIYIQGLDYKINFEWSNILNIVISNKYIHIYLPMNVMIFIPKKAFNNIDELNQLIHMLQNKVFDNIFVDTKIKKIKFISKQIKQYLKSRK